MSLNNWLNFGCRLFAWVVMIWENSSDITPEVAKWSTKFQQNRPLCNWCPMTWVFIEYTFFLLFLSKLRTKRCVTTPLLPFKKWWSTTGRFWDAKYLSTKIIYFYAFFKNFSWFPCIVSLSVKMAALITHHISVNWTLFIFKSSLSCAIVASQYFVFNKFFKKKKMTVEQEMCSCLITASYDGIIRVWGRGLIRLFLFLIKVLK